MVITQKRKICNKHSPKEKNCKKLDEVSMASHKNVGKNTIGKIYSNIVLVNIIKNYIFTTI